MGAERLITSTGKLKIKTINTSLQTKREGRERRAELRAKLGVLAAGWEALPLYPNLLVSHSVTGTTVK